MGTRYQKILVVEDDEALASVISQNLVARGHDVVLATTAEQALTRIVEDQPDLILLDIMLPDRPGWEILRRLEGYDIAIAPPVVVISAVRVSPERLREFHPLAYLPKPFPLDALLRVIEDAGQPDEREEIAPMDRDSLARYQAHLALRSACRTLAATSPQVVSAFTVSLGKGEYEDTPAEWKAMARILAEQYKLQIEVSMVRDHLRIRISREEPA